jgi:glyoxylase-like metal-dependent hydrolase (beta-lactamase superfamily II)
LVENSLQSYKVHSLDLHFRGLAGTIASYLVIQQDQAILVECGPGSTLQSLLRGLHAYGLQASDITDILLTHIHLDHAGAAGWFARQGARIHVHPVGASHLLNPEKLLSSAARIYGNQMQQLWGEFFPVPGDKLNILHDNEILQIGELCFKAIDTPGHADHHYAYLLDDLCFSGDIAGIRMQRYNHLRLPMPPPEFHLEKWKSSVERLNREPIRRIAPTHFGIFDDAAGHFQALMNLIDDIDVWIQAIMVSDPDVETINARLAEWSRERALASGLPVAHIAEYEAANPTWMSGYGIQRYWNKYRRISG